MAVRPVNKEGLNLSGYIKPDERTKQSQPACVAAGISLLPRRQPHL